MTTTAQALEALRDALPRVGEPENVWCSVKGSDIRSVVQHIESTAAEIVRLQSELSTLRAATALVQFEQRVEVERLQAECEALRKDAARLDYLDARNAAKNAKNGTTYGWRLTENHNRIALEDHNWPVLDVRAAIDAALSTSTAPSGAEE